MVGPIAPPTVVVDQQPGNVAPVVAPAEVNQPAVAPAVVNHIAPAVAVNNVAQERWRGCNKEDICIGIVVGESVIGVCCPAGAGGGVAGVLEHMGATFAVAIGAGPGTVVSGTLCTLGGIIGTTGYYVAHSRK
ncbi:MAG: hypothetical protein OXF02_05695 [Simkaniaceae bacterium]|nr:hypothetical protein [Simkaniaceae bacterium]